MASREITYLPKTNGKQQSERNNFGNSLGTTYLKATITILAVSLFTVSVILVWQLLTRSDCGCDNKYKKVNLVRGPEPKSFNCKCQFSTRTNLLPFTFPRGGQRFLEHVEKTLKQYISKKDLVSISASAFYKDQTIWKTGFGVLDKYTFPTQTPNENTLYRTGSLAKLLTVFLTFKLLKEKKIACLDDPFHKYAENFAVKNPFNDDVITIRQILSHTSGLPREVPCGPLFSSQSEKICPVNTTYIYQQLQNMEIKFAPGTAVGYSNLGYALLAQGFFEKFGFGYGSWKDWLLREVLYPLDMRSTYLDNTRFVGNTAVSYKGNGIITPNLDWGWSGPSFQMTTSTSDLTKLIMALVKTRNALFHGSTVQEMFRPVFTFPDFHTAFSSGWQIHNHNSLRVITAGGAVPGSSSAVFLVPKIKFGFILLATGREIVPKLAEDIAKNFTKAIISTSLISAAEIKTANNPNLYTGKYTLINKWSDKVRATISFSHYYRRLQLRQKPGYPRTVYLNFIKPEILQIIYPRGLSCMTYAIGQDKEFLEFEKLDSSGRWQQFTLGSFLFKRIG